MKRADLITAETGLQSLKTFNISALTIHYEAIWIGSINDEISYWEAKPKTLERNILLTQLSHRLTHLLLKTKMLLAHWKPYVSIWSLIPFFPGCGKQVSHFSLFHSFFWPFLWWLILLSFLIFSMTKSVLKMTLRAGWLRLFTYDSDQTMCGMELVHEKPAFCHIKRL